MVYCRINFVNCKFDLHTYITLFIVYASFSLLNLKHNHPTMHVYSIPFNSTKHESEFVSNFYSLCKNFQKQKAKHPFKIDQRKRTETEDMALFYDQVNQQVHCTTFPSTVLSSPSFITHQTWYEIIYRESLHPRVRNLSLIIYLNIPFDSSQQYRKARLQANICSITLTMST